MGCCCCKSAENNENGPEMDPLTEQISVTNESDKNMLKVKEPSVEQKSINETKEEYIPEEGSTEDKNVQSMQEDQQKDNLQVVTNPNGTNGTDVVTKLEVTLQDEQNVENAPEKLASIAEPKLSVTPN